MIRPSDYPTLTWQITKEIQSRWVFTWLVVNRIPQHSSLGLPKNAHPGVIPPAMAEVSNRCWSESSCQRARRDLPMQWSTGSVTWPRSNEGETKRSCGQSYMVDSPVLLGTWKLLATRVFYLPLFLILKVKRNGSFLQPKHCLRWADIFGLVCNT